MLLCKRGTQRGNNGGIGKMRFSFVAASRNNVCSPTPRIREQFFGQASFANTCISLKDDDSSIVFASMVCFAQCCPLFLPTHQRVSCYYKVLQGTMQDHVVWVRGGDAARLLVFNHENRRGQWWWKGRNLVFFDELVKSSCRFQRGYSKFLLKCLHALTILVLCGCPFPGPGIK